MKYVDPVFVILARDFADGMSEYRRLLADEPDRIFGHHVLVRFPRFLAAIEGLRVHQYVVTERARRHKDCDKAEETLRCSQLLTNHPPKNGDK